MGDCVPFTTKAIWRIPPLWSHMLSQDKIRVGSSARQMSNHTVKPCQANEGADNKAGNCVQCARGQDGTSWMLQTIVGDLEGFRWQSHPPFSSEGCLWIEW